MARLIFILAITSIALYSCTVKVDKIGSSRDFTNPPDVSSTFALVLVDTYGQEILDDPKIYANMKIYLYENNKIPSILDAPIFDGRIGIEIRGSSSVHKFPKQQYGFETWDENNVDLDVSLAGFPEDSDWILSAPYSDKTLMRNHLAYTLSRQMGRYASRTKFAELYLDEDPDSSFDDGIDAFYDGVYVLMEKIKRGGDRVDIKKLNDEDVEEPEVTGGYILKIDHTDTGDNIFYTDRETRLIHVYPDGDEINSSQEDYIRGYMNDFEDALAGDDFKSPVNGYAKYIDASSFIDYFLIHELLRNIDAFRFSAYMHKDRNDKLKMGPIWDFNLSTGNCNYSDGWKADGWDYQDDTVAQPFWVARLIEDENYKSQLISRWYELRADIFSLENINSIIEETYDLIFEAQERNFVRWDSLYQHVWPNKYFGIYDDIQGFYVWDFDDHDNDGEYEGYIDEVFFLKEWINSRLEWMDNNIGEV